jgi:uncharacterized membrane protein
MSKLSRRSSPNIYKEPGQKSGSSAVVHTQARLAMTSHRGPLPPPEQLEKYEQVCPGAARRIMDFADSEQNHRHSIERKIISNYGWESRIGAMGAFILALIIAVL